MTWVLATNIYMFSCTLVALIYGLRIMFKQKMPMYFQLIVYAVCALAFSRLYYVVAIACYGGLPDIFNLGFIGEAAFLVFIFFSNYGQIDFLVDDRRTMITRYRVIPLLIPIMELILSILAVHYEHTHISIRISYSVLSVLAGFAGYLNVKHLIIPDVEGGIVKSIRGFNLIALITEIAILGEVGMSCFGLTNLILPTQILSGLLYLAILPILRMEVKKWIQ